MFKFKKKIKLTYDERRIILYSLNDFRTKILKEGKCVDVINEAMCEVKPKMKETSKKLKNVASLLSELIIPDDFKYRDKVKGMPDKIFDVDDEVR